MNDLESLKKECLNCHACPLCETRTNVVFGYGNPSAELMFIGEGPGQTEDETGLPFVGKAGHLLDDYLELIDLKRDQVYIANIVKCRPPKNRDPLKEEEAACMHWLQEQRHIVNPKIIICLGRIAALSIIKDDFRITQEHGRWFTYNNTLFMGVYHPAALLRDPSKRPDTFADFRSIRAKAKEICNHLY